MPTSSTTCHCLGNVVCTPPPPYAIAWGVLCTHLLHHMPLPRECCVHTSSTTCHCLGSVVSTPTPPHAIAWGVLCAHLHHMPLPGECCEHTSSTTCHCMGSIVCTPPPRAIAWGVLCCCSVTIIDTIEKPALWAVFWPTFGGLY